MDAPNSLPKHYRIRSSCGLCGEALQPHDPFVALLGHPNLDKIETRALVPYPLPRDGSRILQGSTNIIFCRATPCPLCDASPEAVPLHEDCSAQFDKWCRREDALDRLWAFAAARGPWRGAPDLRLPETSSLALPPAPRVAAAAGLGPLATRLPLELVQRIQDLTGPSLFWRYSAVVNVALRRDESPEAAPGSPVPLGRIAEWVRGRQPVVVGQDAAAALPPVLRITVDARGVASIKRRPQMVQESGRRSATKAFIVWEAWRFRETVAVFKFGVLRLQLPAHLVVPIWDTPTPPKPRDDLGLRAHMWLRTVELTQSGGARTTGLTFLYFCFRLYGIHAHTAAEPSASATNDRLPATVRERTVCVYLPLPEGEEILAMGLQMPRRTFGHTPCHPRFLFRLRLAGLVTIGPNHGRVESPRSTLCPQPPKLLYYNKATGSDPVSVIGICPRHLDGQPFPPWPSEAYAEYLGGSSYVSAASLRDVKAITVLSYGDGVCTGALLEYESGAVAAVGRCQVGVQSQTRVSSPTHITFKDSTSPINTTGFSFAAHSDPEFIIPIPPIRRRLRYHPMRGTLIFWFNKHQTMVRAFDRT